ncbi:hypothetical protein Fmac_027800 [Flemingia macrophylla]|uniref:Uncharacterized protein n=1 Tax=Flemingia macrophylla TaxID=520843 RepID=A0ABD1LIY4_9FABA
MEIPYGMSSYTVPIPPPQHTITPSSSHIFNPHPPPHITHTSLLGKHLYIPPHFQSGPTHNPCLPKLELTLFYGTDPLDWLFQAEQFFTFL